MNQEGNGRLGGGILCLTELLGFREDMSAAQHMVSEGGQVVWQQLWWRGGELAAEDPEVGWRHGRSHGGMTKRNDTRRSGGPAGIEADGRQEKDETMRRCGGAANRLAGLGLREGGSRVYQMSKK